MITETEQYLLKRLSDLGNIPESEQYLLEKLQQYEEKLQISEAINKNLQIEIVNLTHQLNNPLRDRRPFRRLEGW